MVTWGSRRQARGASPGGGALEALQGLPADVLQSGMLSVLMAATGSSSWMVLSLSPYII